MIAVTRRSPVLPNNGIIHRVAGFAVPYNGGFPLVGDAYGANVFPVNAHFGSSLGGYTGLRRPNFRGIVFHPTRLRKNLRKFFLSDRPYLPFVIKDNGPGTRGALVEG